MCLKIKNSLRGIADNLPSRFKIKSNLQEQMRVRSSKMRVFSFDRYIFRMKLNTVFRVESFSKDAPVLRPDCFKTDGDAYILSAAKM